MKISTLGTSSGNPEPGRCFSAVSVETGDNVILFDCGEGISWRLKEIKAEINLIDAIVISHFHPDHVTGIYMLLQMFCLNGRKKDLIVFLPEQSERFEKTLPLFYLFKETFPFKSVFENVENISSFYPFIEIFKNSHLSGYKQRVKDAGESNLLNSYSFSVRENDKIFYYTSDIKNFEGIDFSDKNLVIADAFHPDGEELYELIKQNPGKFILTHGISSKLDGLIKKEKLKAEFADDKKIYLI
ncbi:MAG: hypothetical protein CSB55_02710 [Candidatus Cloacimonadota bacterium]|nr:MAG: hypothetical protein CSB55_02710 [Candidatus Cloacimonadota bacterium]